MRSVQWKVTTEVMRRGWQIAPAASLLILLIAIVQFAGPPAVAALQRHLVDEMGRTDLTTFVLVTAIGLALANTAVAAAARAQACIRDVLSEKMNWGFSGHVIGWSAGTPSLEQYDDPEFLDRLHRVRGSTRAMAGIAWSTVLTVGTVLSLAISLIMLATVSPWFVGMAVLAVPPLLLNGRGRRLVQRAWDRVAADERREATLNDMFTDPDTAKELRVSRNEAMLDRECVRLWARSRTRIRSATLASGLHTFAGWLIFAAAYLGAIVLAIWLISTGSASLGDLALVISLGETMRHQVSGTVRSIGELGDIGHVAAHYDWLRGRHDDRDHPSAIQAVPSELSTGISTRNLTFTYAGADTPAVDGVDLDLPAGTVVALLGENGAGKTTLTKLLLNQYAPQSGRVDVDDIGLDQMDSAAWSRRCSGLLQDFAKLQGPIRDSIAIGALDPTQTSAVEGAISASGAREVVDQLPEGVNTELGLAFGSHGLSHGQWQRLALARGLMRSHPLLLVLDEPTSALDPQVEHQLFEAFFANARASARAVGAIALVVSHRLSTTQDADLIIVMESGRVAESGTHTELIAQQGRYAELYQLQVDAYFADRS